MQYRHKLTKINKLDIICNTDL